MNLTRRKIIHLGGQSFIALGLVAGLPAKIYGLDWRGLLGVKDPKGHGKVIALDGQASVDGETLKLNQRIANGQLIVAEEKARLLLSMPDGSVFQLSGPGKLRLEVSDEGGLIQLLLGGLLGVVLENRQAQYLIQSPTATAGIKGTVFYRHRFAPGEQLDQRFPKGTKEYFCICNGEIEMRDALGQSTLVEDKAEHHSAHVIVESGGELALAQAKFLYGHGDREIDRVIERMGPKKHSRDWLQLDEDEKEEDGY